MPCDNIVTWGKIPAGSQFVLSAKGDENLFEVTAKVNANGVAEPDWQHEDIVPGQKTRAINAGTHCAVHILIVVSADPQKAIVLDAHIAAANGTIDANQSCSWNFQHAGQFAVTIFVSNK